MIKSRQIFVTAFALFSLFFGAGNLILPPQLGLISGDYWWLVTIGFCLSAVLIPILGIAAHAKLQGTIYDFGKKVSPLFSLVYCFLIYAVSVALPSPRTAAVTHEMAIAPIWDSPPILTSVIYFGMVFLFAINRSRILDILGKLLTPAILFILFLIIGISLFEFNPGNNLTEMANPLSLGILEGYQTFDAIGAVVVGGVIIISVNLKHREISYSEKKKLIAGAGLLAGLALLLVYGGLILSGAGMADQYTTLPARTELLRGISILTLGNSGNLFLSVLVALACFTTAVGIVTGTADYIQGRFEGSRKAYLLTALFSCILGVLVGALNVDYIIAVALPALMFMYPVTIILILLNLVNDQWARPLVFRTVVIATLLFSTPDFLGSIGIENAIGEFIPLGSNSLGWLLPALLTFILTNIYIRFTSASRA